jgi:hypothetical protein
MNAKLQERLYIDFPNLFENAKLGPMHSAMCFGCECGDGWYDILRDLCLKIKDTDTKFVQIKEKFGTLRVYVWNATDEVYAEIDKAEALSAKTCEQCGAPGVTRGGGWIQTLCDTCARPDQTPFPDEEE